LSKDFFDVKSNYYVFTDLRMDGMDGWMDGNIEIFINLFADINFYD